MRPAFLLLVLAAGLPASDLKPLVTGVDSIALTVSDLDRSVEFYTKVLSFEKESSARSQAAKRSILKASRPFHVYPGLIA